MSVWATWLYVLFVGEPTAYLRLLLCPCIHLIHSLYSLEQLQGLHEGIQQMQMTAVVNFPFHQDLQSE